MRGMGGGGHDQHVGASAPRLGGQGALGHPEAVLLVGEARARSENTTPSHQQGVGAATTKIQTSPAARAARAASGPSPFTDPVSRATRTPCPPQQRGQGAECYSSQLRGDHQGPLAAVLAASHAP